MSKKMCLTAAVAFGIWNIFYIFVLCNSVVVEYFENKFFYWGFPQWGFLYSSPKFFLCFNLIYIAFLVLLTIAAYYLRKAPLKSLLAVSVITLLSVLNLFFSDYVWQKQFSLFKTEQGKDMSRIPEGVWVVSKERLQSYNDQNLMMKIKGWWGRGDWPGGQRIWGEYRVWLVPDYNTESKGRRGMVLHGGNKVGSPWGINVGEGISRLADFLLENSKPMELTVDYSTEDKDSDL